MNELETILEKVGLRAGLSLDKTIFWNEHCISNVLKKELLPLLKAGERHHHLGCEDGWYACPLSEDYINHGEEENKRKCECGYDDYLAAKTAVLESLGVK